MEKPEYYYKMDNWPPEVDRGSVSYFGDGQLRHLKMRLVVYCAT